jgi:hypothetical protein
MTLIDCLSCGLPIHNGRKNKKYCSSACRQKSYRQGFHEAYKQQKMLEQKNSSIIISNNLRNHIEHLIIETTEQMRCHFKNYGSNMLNVFIYYKISWNLNGEDFVKQMKWFLKCESVFNWYYACFNEDLLPRTKHQQIEYDNYCKFLKSIAY